MSSRRRHVALRVSDYVILSLFVVISLLPLIWMVSTALKSTDRLFEYPPRLIPDTPTLAGFAGVLGDPLWHRYFFNSFVVAAAVTLVSVVLGTAAGYGFSRFDFRGKKALLLGILGSNLFPATALIIPLFVYLSRFGLIDSYPGLFVSHLLFALPIVVWLMIGFFERVPVDLEEAAMIDGCTRMGAILRVAIPLVLPGLISSGVVAFLSSWTEFLYAVTLMNSEKMRTVAVGIFLEMGQYDIGWNRLMAACVLINIPVIALFLLFSRHFVQGWVDGATKG
jgi:multiple sugar transport system permease protein